MLGLSLLSFTLSFLFISACRLYLEHLEGKGLGLVNDKQITAFILLSTTGVTGLFAGIVFFGIYLVGG